MTEKIDKLIIIYLDWSKKDSQISKNQIKKNDLGLDLDLDLGLDVPFGKGWNLEAYTLTTEESVEKIKEKNKQMGREFENERI